MQRFFNQLIPFLLAGIAIVAFAFGILMLAYLFLFGAIVGFILFIAAWIRQKFFPKKTLVKTTKKKSVRTIDVSDWKEL
jgi:hypothetical protein